MSFLRFVIVFAFLLSNDFASSQSLEEVDSLDQQLLGVWSRIPRTIENLERVSYQTGFMEVDQKLSEGRYRVRLTASFNEELKPGYKWTSGECQGSSSNCSTKKHATGILTVDGSQVIITFDDLQWPPDHFTLNGSTLFGTDVSGPLKYVKR